MIGLEFLKNIEIFQGLDSEQLAEIIKCGEEEAFEHETRLFEKGENAAYLWIVREGQVELRFDFPGLASAEENTLSSVTEAGAFGWSSIVPPNKYRLSGYSTGEGCKLIKFERESLLKLFKKDPDIGYVVMLNLATLVGTRFHNLQEEAASRRGQDLMGGW
jgi:signal-transduction protein with cAMP-binding, CBS, and nucleotidyltransferase domain